MQETCKYVVGIDPAEREYNMLDQNTPNELDEMMDSPELYTLVDFYPIIWRNVLITP